MIINWHWGRNAASLRRAFQQKPPQHKLVWREIAPGRWRAHAPLPDRIPKAHVIIPGLATLDPQVGIWHVYLDAGDQTARIAAIGVTADGTALADQPAELIPLGIRTPVDYFELAHDLLNARLRFEFTCHPDTNHTPRKPLDWHASISIRPAQLTAVEGQGSNPRTRILEGLAPTGQAGALISQRALPAPLNAAACSPCCIAMGLQQRAERRPAVMPTPQDFAAACRHPGTGLYGVWPQNAFAAAQLGTLVSVLALANLDDAIALQRAGFEMVASVRFATDALPRAPMPQTGGHLVGVRAITADTVLVADPAARSAHTVLRLYPRAAFARAWLAERGGAYLFHP